jgi:hypothetical protein
MEEFDEAYLDSLIKEARYMDIELTIEQPTRPKLEVFEPLDNVDEKFSEYEFKSRLTWPLDLYFWGIKK